MFRLLTAAVAAGAFWVAAVPAMADPPCGGTGGLSAFADPRAEYESASVAGIGRMVRSEPGHLIVHLTSVIKGNRSDIDVGEQQLCDGPALGRTSGFFLTRDSTGWGVDPAPAAAVRAAARPLVHNGSGQAVLLETTASSRDPLATLDARGRILFTAPPSAVNNAEYPSPPYQQVSVCPGRRTAIAWRPDGHAVRLSLPDLQRLGRGPTAKFRYQPIQGSPLSSARCNTSDGRVALAVIDGQQQTFNQTARIALLTMRRQRTLLRERNGSSELVDARHVLVRPPSALELVDALTGAVRWRLPQPGYSATPSVAPDGRHAIVTVGRNGVPAVVDLRSARPQLRRLSRGTVGTARWIGSDRLVLQLGVVQLSPLRSPILDLLGRVVGHVRIAGDAPLAAGRWMYMTNVDSMNRAPRGGGSLHKLRLSLWAAGLQSLTD